MHSFETILKIFDRAVSELVMSEGNQWFKNYQFGYDFYFFSNGTWQSKNHDQRLLLSARSI